MSSKQTNKDNPSVVKHQSIIIIALFTFVILSNKYSDAAPAPTSVKHSSTFNKPSFYLKAIYDNNQYSKQHERNSNEFIATSTASQRVKRSPYPPGFVTWDWTEPCFCPPGVTNCRCYSRLANTKSERKPSGSPSKAKRRVTRSKKNKF